MSKTVLAKWLPNNIACFGGLIAHQIAVFAGILNMKDIIMFATIFAVLMVKMVRSKSFSPVDNIADGDHHQQ